MVGYRFTNKEPEDQTITDILNLNAFNEEQLEQFAKIVFGFLSQRTNLLEDIATFGNEQGLGQNALRNIVRGFIFFCREALKTNLTPAYVKEDLVRMGLNEDKAIYIATQWKANFLSLSRSIIGQTLTVNELLDMEWSFGVTTASNELQKSGSTFLQLKLVFDNGNGSTSVQHMELSLAQFYQFLRQMELAKTNLEYFS